MSVLGVKNWSTELGDATGGPEGHLVLGQYPLPFVNEVARSTGASFFDTLSFTEASLSNLGMALSPSHLGSLMPFSLCGRPSQHDAHRA